MTILGISFETHETSVALIEDGSILFAAAEERYSRRKMDTAFPSRALKECLRETGVRPCEIECVAISGFPPFKNWFYYMQSFLTQKIFTKGKDFFSIRFNSGNKEIVLRWIPALLVNMILCTGIPQFFYMYLFNRMRLAFMLRGFKGKILYIPHHSCHAASACFTSGTEDALSVVMEGLDWENTVVIDEFHRGEFKPVFKTPWPHSPGYYYCLVTTILGFNYLRHSGKITGLAAFGNPDAVYDKVKMLMWAEGMTVKVSPLIYTLVQEYLLKKRIPDYFQGHSIEDIAAGFQRRLEDVLVDVVKNACRATGQKTVVLSGGVSANVLVNQKIHHLKEVESVFIHPGMTDAGLALGAALFALNAQRKKSGGHLKSRALTDVYFGSGYYDNFIREELDRFQLNYAYQENIEYQIAKLLAEKNVIARFNGRMEYGPRALGNRSILCHAGDKNINDWLNKRLGRTEFMPFAPSVLDEDRDIYFKNVNGAEYAAQFMTITLDSTERMQRECPAAVHIDGTARPQFVTAMSNPSYYKILQEYKALTGIGVILNTSFNMHEEPIVCSPDDAVRSFLRGHLDYLAIGKFLVKNNIDCK